MRTHDFDNSIIIGEEGEAVVVEYIKNTPNAKKVRPVQNVWKYRKKDIDLIVELRNGRYCGVEIKTDTYNSGNIFYETMSAVETGSLGCMEKTEADYLFYYFIPTKELYIIDMKKYRTWFDINKNTFNLKTFKNNRRDGGTYTSQGYIIPKQFLEDNFKNYKKVILN